MEVRFTTEEILTIGNRGRLYHRSLDDLLKDEAIVRLDAISPAPKGYISDATNLFIDDNGEVVVEVV